MARATVQEVIDARNAIEDKNAIATIESVSTDTMLSVKQWYALQQAENERAAAIKAARDSSRVAKPAKRLRQATANDIYVHKAFFQYQPSTAKFLRFNADPTIINGTRAVRHSALGFIILSEDTLQGWLVEVGEVPTATK